MTTVDLPWPSTDLSPNARVHWSRKAKATKEARNVARWLTAAAKGRTEVTGGIGVSLTFHPPDKRRRDADNLLSSCKGVLDGIADALGIDDSRFEVSFRIGEPVKGGSVRVEITPL